jgi:hypothetical protein
MTYYVLAAGTSEPKGPFSVPELLEHIAAGWLDANAQLARPGEPDWFPIHRVPEFSIELQKQAAPAGPARPSRFRAAAPAKKSSGLAIILSVLGLGAMLFVLFVVYAALSGGSTSSDTPKVGRSACERECETGHIDDPEATPEEIKLTREICLDLCDRQFR